MLVHPGGVLTDSTDILHWADAQAPPARRLFPGAGAERAEVERLEAYFDEELGPAGRLWMYHHVLDGAAGPALKYNCTGVPSWQRRLFPMAFPVVAGVIKRVLHVAPATAEAALSRAQRVLDEVAVRLADGRPYLVGGHFSAADLTFAALCAPLLAPPGYGVPLPRPEELPPACARVIEASRAHPAGRFALGLYETHRRT